ncbi:hypothetical protein AGLY_002258, partial [Aphis glycines]
MDLVVVRGSESPSLFTAVTRNLYSLPGSKLEISTSGSLILSLAGTLHTLTHFPVATSIFSTSYSVIGQPPSSSGFFHFNLQLFLVISVTSSGPFGESGFPKTVNSRVASSLPEAFSATNFLCLQVCEFVGLLGAPGPALFTAFTRNSYQNITLYSIIYPVIGAPPSFSGLVHFKSAWSLSQSTSSTLFGLP